MGKFVKKRIIKTIILGAGAVWLLMLNPLAAISDDAVEDSDATVENAETAVQLEPMTVTSASGFEQNIADAPASITVITGEELSKKSYTSVADAIKNVPGVYLSPSGNVGISQDISIRGMSSAETLFLVDGKPVSSGKNFDSAGGQNGIASVGGSQNWYPPISMIERIEIIRGPMSSLYGSNALGGVINIITKKPTEKWTGSITTEYLYPDNDNSTSGKKSSTSLTVSGALIKDLLSARINGSYQNTESVTDDEGDDLTGKEYKRAGGKLMFTPGDNNDFALEYNHDRQEADSDSTGNKYDKDVVSLSHDGRYGKLTTSVYYQYDRTTRIDGSEISTGVYADRVEQVHLFNAQGTYLFDRHTATFGGQYKFEKYKNDTQGLASISGITMVDRWLGALYAEDEWRMFDDFALTLGARYNDDENFGGHLTPRAYGVYHLTDVWTLKGGVSTGYNQPGLTAISEGWGQARGGSGSTSGVFIGNPDLEPEESINYEAGVNFDQSSVGLSGSLTVFHTDYKNKIVTSKICSQGEDCSQWTTRGWVNQYQNVADAEMQGVELTMDYKVTNDVKLTGSYTFAESEMKNAVFNKGQSTECDLSGQPLNRTPRHLVNLILDWQATPKLDLWAQYNYSGKASAYVNLSKGVSSSSTTASTYNEETPAYATVDLGLVYHVNEKLALKGGIYNLTNKEIMKEDYNITLDGRRYQVSATYDF